MEPIAKARAQAPWKVCSARQGLFWGVSTLKWGLSPESCSRLCGWKQQDWPNGEMPAPDPTQLAPSPLSPPVMRGQDMNSGGVIVPLCPQQCGTENCPLPTINVPTSGGWCCRGRGGGSWPVPGSSRTSPAPAGTHHGTSAPGRRAAPPARGQGMTRGVTGVPPLLLEPGQGNKGVLYLQVLDSPLDAPAMLLQGCLALLGGHTVHRVLHLGGSLWSLSAATSGQQEACD